MPIFEYALRTVSDGFLIGGSGEAYRVALLWQRNVGLDARKLFSAATGKAGVA